ncbi:hypothetical protein [Bacillus sp. FJAT-50079]|uniref:hypothetical protein n=1 Tax=Bacillus sp. FJAT-50079 TaxID=2833577 RepID=UPI001BC918D5|nr:hypothetical protein [Bacillus sp. FJAT-50079]MBS4207971.1 hypothetical protein [Bacillus sp. FJAT-50079]
MFELILQDSYAEWIVPLTLAVIWILSLQLFSLGHPVYTRNKSDFEPQMAIIRMPEHVIENPDRLVYLLMRTIKRKESPDDSEGPHLSI